VVSSGSAAAQGASIRGVVRDGSGSAVAGALVAVSAPGMAVPRVVESRRDGQFEVTPLADGEYTVEVAALGFAAASRRVGVPATDAVELILTPAPVVETVQVISASRQEELRESLNTNVAVVSRRTIEDSGSQTAGEVLREVPGVVTRRGSETAGAAGEQIQGIESRQVLVLLDGQPLLGARGIKRGVVNLDRQSVARLDRIEVVKGASSALYGSDAIGGVINLISRDSASPLDLAGELSAGSRGEVNGVANAGGQRGRWSGLVSLERHENDGFDLTPTTVDTTGAPFARVDGLARLRLTASDALSFSVLGTGYDNRTHGRSIGELGAQQDDIDESTANVHLQANWLPRATSAVTIRAYGARFDEASEATLAPPAATPLPPGALDERLFKADVSIAQGLGNRQQLQAGLEFWRDEYSGINRLRDDTGEEASIGTAWAQHRLTVGTRLTTTLGLRADRHSEFGSAVSPKVAANARLGGGVTVRASYGRGFRAPDIGQLYYRFLNPSSIYQVIGNPNLEPEYANSLQLGASYATPARRARLGVNLFRNDVCDLIESVSLGFAATPAQVQQILEREGLDPSFNPVAGRLFFTYKNVNDAVTKGVEADGEVALTSALSLSAAYTYLDARDDATDLRLTGRHTHQGHVRLAFRHLNSGFTANVRGLFYGDWIAARATVNGVVLDTTASGYGLWDAFASQRLVGGLTAFAAVDNLTDNQDPNTGQLSATGSPLAIYRPEAGRTIRAGLRWSWTK
jgi:outer membrane receptor for ferrienterochelin and colicins